MIVDIIPYTIGAIEAGEGDKLAIEVVVPMVLKTGTDKEPKKRLIIGFMIRPGSDRWSNR